jgi:succinate-semialdehyde dehydrogenase/glutarate-semialdehyde dehydrogenase
VSIATINPATGETVKTFTPATDDEVEAAIARAHERFLDYRHSTTFAQRAKWANATADLLEKEADETAAMMTLEMGKTLKSAKGEAIKCAKGFRYYAENAEKLLADEPAEASQVGAKRAYTRWQPLGVVLAVMPWNFPLWQAVRFAAPAMSRSRRCISPTSSPAAASRKAVSRRCWCPPALSRPFCAIRGSRRPR